MSFKHRLIAYDPNAITIKQHAELGTLSPFLGENELGELWAEGTEFSKEAYQRLIKEKVEDGKLACMTIGQWIEASEKEKEFFQHERPGEMIPVPENTGNNDFVSVGAGFELGFTFGIHITDESSIVPQNRIGGYLGDTSRMSAHEKAMAERLYMVNRTEFRKWLQNNDEWPLPEKCLLARWWDNDEGDEEANTLQAAATKQQEKAIQVLINRVVQANPKASTVEVWNKLREYDTEQIIVRKEPQSIKTIKGNKEAFLEYTDPKRGTVYAPIKLKAFQERCTRAKKEVRLNNKT